MVFIDLTSSAYSNLSKFGVLAQSAITSTGTTTVNSGLWGIPTGVVIANMAAGTPPSGLATGIQAANAQLELTTLRNAISVTRAALPITVNLPASPGNYTFSPNINYINNISSGITFTNNSITFDAGGDNNAQFFITATGGVGNLVFNTSPFTLQNGARACNIFS